MSSENIATWFCIAYHHTCQLKHPLMTAFVTWIGVPGGGGAGGGGVYNEALYDQWVSCLKGAAPACSLLSQNRPSLLPRFPTYSPPIPAGSFPSVYPFLPSQYLTFPLFGHLSHPPSTFHISRYFLRAFPLSLPAAAFPRAATTDSLTQPSFLPSASPPAAVLLFLLA